MASDLLRATDCACTFLTGPISTNYQHQQTKLTFQSKLLFRNSNSLTTFPTMSFMSSQSLAFLTVAAFIVAACASRGTDAACGQKIRQMQSSYGGGGSTMTAGAGAQRDGCANGYKRFPGKDIKENANMSDDEIASPTASGCDTICNSRNGCKGWSWSKHFVPSGMCYLKSGGLFHNLSAADIISVGHQVDSAIKC